MNGVRSLRDGVGYVIQRWQLVIPLYLINLGSALILILLPTLLLIAPAQNTAMREAANGINGWLLLDIVLSPQANQVLGIRETTSTLQQVGLIGVITITIIPTIAGLTNAFVNGGLLLSYHERAQPFQWRRSLWGCWHWCGAFLLLGFLQFILALVVFSTLISGATMFIGFAGEWSAWVVIPLVILLALVWLGLMELTGAQLIVHNTRNFARAFWEALRYCFRHPLNLLACYGLTTIVLVAAHLIFNFVMPYVPLSWFPLVLVIQQTFVIVRLGLRLTRAAGSVALLATT